METFFLLLLAVVGLSQAGMMATPTKKACNTDADCGADQCCLTVREDSPAIGKRDGTTMASHKECRNFQKRGSYCCSDWFRLVNPHEHVPETCGCEPGFVCQHLYQPNVPIPIEMMYFCRNSDLNVPNMEGVWDKQCPYDYRIYPPWYL